MNTAEIKLAGKLVAAQLRWRPGRIALAACAIIASACVVVWVVSGYDSLVEQFDVFSEKYLGRYQFVIVPKVSKARPDVNREIPNNSVPSIPGDLLDGLRRDPTVALADPVFQTRAEISRRTSEGQAPVKLKSDELPMLVGTDASEQPYPMIDGRWIGGQSPDQLEGAISQGAADRLGVRLGDEVSVASSRGAEKVHIRIVGIVEQLRSLPPLGPGANMPSMRVTVLKQGPADAALYVPMVTAEKLIGKPTVISFVGMVLKPGVDVTAFRADFARRFSADDSSVEIQAVEEVQAELAGSSTTQMARTQAYTATGISSLAALFIIFTTLSIGVHERVRQFALLRAVALTRIQIAWMILLESIVLGTIGWLFGVLAGWVLLRVVEKLRPDFFPAGVALGTWCILLAGVCSLGGSLLAAVIPAWRATKVSPLEAMVMRPVNHALPSSLTAALIGLVLIAINPLVVFYLPLADQWRYAMSAAIGCSSAAIGFTLLAPALIVSAEKYVGPGLARLMGLNPGLLTGLLTTNLWRTLGTTISLTLGLGLFVAMQTWGYSMLGPFLPGKWLPELLVMVGPDGITDDALDEMSHVDGIISQQFLPMAVEQVRFADDLTGAQQRASVTRQDNCILVGVDPQRALGSESPMLGFRFVQGTRSNALAKLQAGRYCLVPDHFQRESGLGIGDKFAVVPPPPRERRVARGSSQTSPDQTPDEIVEYEIAGVVSMEGWHLVSKGGLRTRNARSAAMVIAPFEEVRRDLHQDRTKFVWANVDSSADKKLIAANLQAIVSRSSESTIAVGAVQNNATVKSKVHTQWTLELNATVTQRADSIIWGLSQLPLITLAVTSIGVINTVLSSVRARRWEFGVLRSVGVTRFGLVRLVIAEALLVGIVACVLSLGFGTATGYCGTEVTRYVDIHGGLIAPLVIPWKTIAPGFGLTLLLCFLAALGPAIALGRTEPLRLLKAGRGY